MKAMRFADLKKWFRRRRHDGRLKEDQRVPASRETQKPPEQAAPGPVTAEPSAEAVTTNKRAPLKKGKRAKPSASGPSTANSVASRPLSRQGIPILEPDEDLTTHFRDPAVDETRRNQPPGPAGVADQRPPAASPASHPPAAPRRRNRAGIRQLDDDTDLHAHFMAAPNDAP